MSLSQVDWAALASLEPSDLRRTLFSLIQAAAVEIQERDPDDPEVLSLVPRIAELVRSRSELRDFSQVLDALARSVGLWNYIDARSADPRDLLIAEAATIHAVDNITLHREQVAALNILLAGKNLILSAPTSFGKSILIDVLLATGRYRRVAIVLPTIALLDEFRRRLISRFGARFDIIMHHSDVPTKEHVVFLGTQERLLNRTDLQALDLVVVDEFYKLDPARRDERSITLNAAVYKLLKRTKQFFFLGPNIEKVQTSPNNRWQFKFLQTRFSTVAVDTFDLRKVPDKKERLIQEVFNEANWPALVFVSAPDKANQLANTLAETGLGVGAADELANWIDENYGGRWEISNAVRAGIGIHHGRIPRALASRFVRLFNEKQLSILLCTSTLIEGVNTAAKSVFIYDKTINKFNYDFFTFSNIRGRAGRLGEHYVGKVFLFHTPPGQEEVEVTAPLFGDLSNAPDEFVVHIGEEDTSDRVADRVEELAMRLGLSEDELRRLSSIGIDTLQELRDRVDEALYRGMRLGWSDWPSYDEIQDVAYVICQVRAAQNFGVATFKQLTLYLEHLRRSESLAHFFSWHSSSYRGDEMQIDKVFKFLRACEYGLPELFSAVELFTNKRGRFADYKLFIAELPRWFRAEALKNLEEEGIPIQISERFLRSGDTAASLGRRLRKLAEKGDPRLKKIERQWILDAIPLS